MLNAEFRMPNEGNGECRMPNAEWRVARRIRCWAQREDIRIGEMVGVAGIGLVGGIFFWLLTLYVESGL